jgi:hypothetical protein
MLSYTALAKSLFKEAHDTTDSSLRRVRLADVRRVARAGIRYYRTVPWLPVKGYFVAARTELAELYQTLGRTAELAGAPLDRRLDYLRMAYRIYPGAPTALLLAEALFEKASPDQVDLARGSLTYCRDYARKEWSDPQKHPAIRATLGIYPRRFPMLAPEVDHALADLEHLR